MKVLVTGATGFVGGAVIRDLTRRGHMVRAVVRAPSESIAAEQVVVEDIGPTAVWTDALHKIDAVVHLAARVHNLRDDPSNSDQYFQVNTRGTLNLATAAQGAGVKRFVFVSTIKVNGERTDERPFRADDPPQPTDAYGESKLMAEQGLRKLDGIECVIVRPPLVYGPGVKGNLARLCRLAAAGLPLPLGCVSNRRDLIGIENMVDLIDRCLIHPAAANRTFLASDGKALSTPDLYQMICDGLGTKAKLFRAPLGLLRTVARPFGLSAEVGRLTESLEICIESTRSTLDWTPPRSARDGITTMAQAWAASRR